MSRAVLRTALLAGFDVQAVESDLRVRGTHYVDGRFTAEPHLPTPPMDLPDCQEAELRAAQRVRLPDDAPTLLMQLAGNLSVWPQYSEGPKIGLTMTESDNLCRYWKHGLRNVDLALAPSNFCLDTFRRVVPGTPSELFNLPVDDRLWEPGMFAEEIHNRPPFLFLSVFSTCPRKLWRELMLAFAEEFSKEGDEVGLVVRPGHTAEVVQMADWCNEMGAWVKVDVEKRTYHMLGALYRACQVYVQPSSEGFGLPFVESALCGVPSIGLSMGGAADIVSEETGYVCPAMMAPIPGHMPQVYDRKEHNFAITDIDSIRRTLRRAYEEERAGAAKGEAARKNAMAKFAPAMAAPRLVELVEQGKELHRKTVYAACHPVRPQWATVAGAWGDVMCGIGKVRAMMADKEIPQVGLVYYGRDPRIVEWLEIQPWVREVFSVIDRDQETMTEVYGRLCMTKPVHSRAAWREVLEGADFPGKFEEIAFTELRLNEWEEPVYWRGAVLPQEAHVWAENVASTLSGEFLLLNPLSIASNRMKDHWRYWSQAMTWLLDNTAVPIVMVGERLIDWPTHPMLVNVSGTSRSMMDVLALAERAAGVVTTSNNLAHYCVIAELPCVCVAARTFGRYSFYHRYNHAEPLTIVDWDGPLGDFQWAMSQRLFKSLKAERDNISEAEYYADHLNIGLGRA